MSQNTRKLVYSALCLALALLLPFLTGQIQQFGAMLSPMHLPVLLCGYLCGGPWGAAVGFVAPLLRNLLFHMPQLFPSATAMAFELAAYGFLAGTLHKALGRRGAKALYGSLVLAMLGGRAVWGAVMFVLSKIATAVEFSPAIFFAGAFANAWPGIVLQLILVPVIVAALERAKLTAHD